MVTVSDQRQKLLSIGKMMKVGGLRSWRTKKRCTRKIKR